MSDNSDRKPFEVGYSRPPKASQFRPGQSGNPRGRRKGARSIGAILREILAQRISITENGRTRRVPRVEAILLRMASDASRGEARALGQIIQLAERYGGASQGDAQSHEFASEDLAILQEYLSEGVEAEADPSDSPAVEEGSDVEGR